MPTTAIDSKRYSFVFLLLAVEIMLGLLLLVSPRAAIPLVGLLIAGILLFSLIRPDWVYYLVILSFSVGGITLFAHNLPGVPGHKTLNPHHLLILLTFLGTVMLIVRHRKRLKRTPLDLPIVLLLLWALLGTLWAPNFKASLLQVFRFFVALIFYFASFQLITDRNRVHTLVKVWFLLGLISVLLAFSFPHGVRSDWYVGATVEGPEAPEGIIKRHEGLSSHPNTCGMLVGIPIALGLGLFFSCRSGTKKLYYVLAIIAMTSVLILSFSKAWIIGTFAGALVLFFKMKKLKAVWITVLSIMLIGSVLALSDDVRTTLIQRFFHTPEASEVSLQKFGEVVEVRMQLWRVGFRFFAQSYAIGTGLGGFAPRVGEVLPARAGQQAHSLFLNVLFELGAIGMLLFIWAVIALIGEVVKYSKQMGGTMQPLFLGWLAGLVAMGVNIFVRQTLGSTTLWSFLALGLLIMKFERPYKRDKVS
jgi:O-antigen ligase